MSVKKADPDAEMYGEAQPTDVRDSSALPDPHGVQNLLHTAVYDTGGESVEGGFVDHWIPNAITAIEQLKEIFAKYGFSQADAALIRQVLRRPDAPLDALRVLLESLGRDHPDLREFVKQTLRDPEPRARIAALRAGASLFDPLFLLQLLDDPDADVRAAAVTSLKGPEAQAHLIHALDDPERSVRSAAARAVRFCRNPIGAEALRRRLEIEPDVEVRKAIITSVAETTRAAGVGQRGQVPLAEVIGEPMKRMLLRELNNEDAEIRRAVAAALERVGGADVATAMLERLLVEEDRDVRLALVHYPGPGYGGIREQALPVFSSLLLSDPDLAVRVEIAFLMGSLGPGAAPALLAVLDGDPGGGLQRAAALSLQYVGDVRALPSLMRLLADPAKKYDHYDFEKAIRGITLRAAFSEPLAPSPEAVARLRSRIDALQPDPRREWLIRICKEELDALPIHSSAIYLWAIRPDGTVLCMDHEAFGLPTEPETDALRRFAVVVQGARRYPELREFVPPPPKTAWPCDGCWGTGSVTEDGGREMCFRCSGLGWYTRE